MGSTQNRGAMDNLELIMSWLGMSQYVDRFREAGFDSWETITWITEQDLETLEVELGHRRKLQKEIASSQRLAQGPAPGGPLYGLTPLQQLPGDPSSPEFEDERPRKRGYRHHPKPDPNAPERPYSAYVMFSNHARDQLKAQNLSFSNLSKQVGERWQAMSEAEREGWKQAGAGPWEDYKARLAEYRKTDHYREYQKYVSEFKAAQEAKKPARRQRSTSQWSQSAARPTLEFGTVTSSSSASIPRQSGSSISNQADPTRRSIGSATKRPMDDIRVQETSEATKSVREHRTCKSCRRSKVKCDGNKPKCKRCRHRGSSCDYSDDSRTSEHRWAARKTSPFITQTAANLTVRDVESVWQKFKAYEALLLQLAGKVDGDDAQAIQDAISRQPQLGSSREAKASLRSESTNLSGDDSNGGESQASDVGSMGSTDRVNEQIINPDKDSLAFEGQASEAKWLQKLTTELDNDSEDDTLRSVKQNSTIPLSAHASSIAKRFRMNTEDVDMSVVGNQIYPLELPIKSTADRLLEAYFSTVQLSFPIFDRGIFMAQYEDVYSAPDLAVYRDRTFIASLQLVFGIGAVHAHLVDAEWAGDERDHVLYIACARMLAVDGGLLNDLCHLDQVRVFALGAFYLLTTEQINRSWNLAGLALRAAQAMGLHLLNVTPSLSESEKDQRARVWFSVVSLESILVMITGRPSMIRERDCSVSLLRVLEEGSRSSSMSESASPGYSQGASTGSSSLGASDRSAAASSQGPAYRGRPSVGSIYFKYYTEICNLAKEAVGELYSPGIRSRKWTDVQEMIRNFGKRLFEWSQSLGPPFTTAAAAAGDSEIESCSIALQILYHSTNTIINRPCLCRLNERISDQSRSSKNTNSNFASSCVNSARAVLGIILSTPPSIILRHGVTWWMILNHLKRALIVLLLELSYRAAHMPTDAGEILTEAKSALNWLRQISAHSPKAVETWITLTQLLLQAAQRVGGDTADMIIPSSSGGISNPPPPPAGGALDPSFSQMDFANMPPPPPPPPPPPQPSGAYDPADPSVFPPLGLHGNFAQGEWDDFGFEGPQTGMSMDMGSLSSQEQ
ncbi:hypothetical protein ACLMJK_003233 [Lecanora helva]